MFSRFREEEPTDEDFEALGSNKAYHIDLIPKVIVAYGSMARLLREIGVYDSLELQLIDLHMAYSGRSKKIGRVRLFCFADAQLPSSPEDASRSSVLSIMQRIRCRSLLQSVQEQCEEKSPEAGVAKLPLSNATMEDTYHKFTISEGHAGDDRARPGAVRERRLPGGGGARDLRPHRRVRAWRWSEW